MSQFDNRTVSAVVLGLFIIGVAAGFILYSTVKDDITIILWTVLIVGGLALVILSDMFTGKDTGFGPSESAYRAVVGAVCIVIGIVGMLFIFTDVDLWVLAAIFLIAIAVIGMAVALSNGRKEVSK